MAANKKKHMKKVPAQRPELFCDKEECCAELTFYSPENTQQDHAADYGETEAAQVEAGNFAPAQLCADEAAHNAAQYAQDDRNNIALRFFAGEDHFGQRTGNKSENNPGEYAHKCKNLSGFDPRKIVFL